MTLWDHRATKPPRRMCQAQIPMWPQLGRRSSRGSTTPDKAARVEGNQSSWKDATGQGRSQFAEAQADGLPNKRESGPFTVLAS